ncbi:hypothetical protein [Lysobacter gummosus]
MVWVTTSRAIWRTRTAKFIGSTTAIGCGKLLARKPIATTVWGVA